MQEEARALEAIREAEAALQERYVRAEAEAARIVADARSEAARLVAEEERRRPPRETPPVSDPLPPLETLPPLPPSLTPLIERLADELFRSLREEGP